MPPPASGITWDRRHLLQLEGLSRADLTGLLDAAEAMLPVATAKAPARNTLSGRTVVNLFLEDSTRTRSSFTLAARRCGADVLEFSAGSSSLSKGESVLDTARNIHAMGVHAIVVRSSASGAPHLLARHLDCPIINAGDGRHEHPTQGLLDLLTIRQRLGEIAGLTVAIVGDIAASRVARSAAHGLTTLGADVVFVGPPAMVPASFEQLVTATGSDIGSVSISHELDEVLPAVDAVMMLRIQFERHGDGGVAAKAMVGAASSGGGATSTAIAAPAVTTDYRQSYGLTAARTAMMKPGAIVLHPGPVNLGIEIDAEVADDPDRSVILQQVTNGVAVRMAVLETLLNRG